MADFVDQKRREMETRMREIQPLVEEYERLQAAVAALHDACPAPPTRPAQRAKRTITSTTRTRASSNGDGRRGRPKGSGQRGKQALEIVRATPGISIPEIAEAMGIKQNYLYRVMPGLQQDGLVTKKGRGWFAKEPAKVAEGAAA